MIFLEGALSSYFLEEKSVSVTEDSVKELRENVLSRNENTKKSLGHRKSVYQSALPCFGDLRSAQIAFLWNSIRCEPQISESAL